MKKFLFTLGLVSALLVFSASAVIAEALTPELCKAKAIAAAKLIETEGEAAFEKFKDEKW